MNVQLRAGMNPLWHCNCKMAVVSSPDGVCSRCEKGEPPRYPDLTEWYKSPKYVNWQILRAKRVIR